MKNKIKVSKSVVKRIKKVTHRGIVIMSQSAQHLATNKSKRRRGMAKNYQTLNKGDASRLRKLIT